MLSTHWFDTPRLSLRLGVLSAWAWLNYPALQWLMVGWSQPVHAVQRVALLGLTLWAAWEFLTRPTPAKIHTWTNALVTLGLLGVVATRLGHNIHTLDAVSALFLLFALGGYFSPPNAWSQGWVGLFAVLLCLPIQSHVDAHLGLPLRLWTASTVAPLLQAFGIPNISIESIIVTENSVADVASACSGVRTLWYALLVWLSARLLWPGCSAWRWLASGVASMVLVMGFNAFRVGALVAALHFQVPTLLAHMAHGALGLMALAAVAALNVWRCRCPPVSKLELHGIPPSWVPPVGFIVMAVVLGACFPTGRSTVTAQLLERAVLPWPAALHSHTLTLTDLEKSLLTNNQAELAQKIGFRFEHIEGSLLVVQSKNWRTHHAPELCLLAQGLRIEKLMQVSTVYGSFRVIQLQPSGQTAITWFQSGQQILPDLKARFWAQLWHPQTSWSMVTVLINTLLSETDTLQLQQMVHQVVNQAPQFSE
jgi:exosortase O